MYCQVLFESTTCTKELPFSMIFKINSNLGSQTFWDDRHIELLDMWKLDLAILTQLSILRKQNQK